MPTLRDAVVGDDLAEHLALQDVGRGVTEVQALVGVVDSFFDVLAGENITTPAFAILSITLSVTAEEAAPMMASTFSPSSRSTVCVATVGFCGVAESPSVSSTSLPLKPPASLISSMARRRRRSPVGRGRRGCRSRAAACRSSACRHRRGCPRRGPRRRRPSRSLGRLELGLGVVDAVVGVEGLDAVADATVGSPLPENSSGPDTPS